MILYFRELEDVSMTKKIWEEQSLWLAGAGQENGGNQPEAGVGGTKYYSTKQSSIQEGGNQSMSYFQ